MRPTLFERHERCRRTTWKWTTWAGAAAMLWGLPLSLVLTPLAYLATLASLYVIDDFLAVPPRVWYAADTLAAFVPIVAHGYAEGPLRLLAAVAPLALLLLLPGFVAVLVLWFGVRRLLLGYSLEAAVETLGARVPQDSIAEERQFVELLRETCAAAGASAPITAWITEHRSANMALIGSDSDRAGIVVSRRLLNTCDREETHALIAHLIGSLASGDALVATRLESAYLTGAALHALANAPFGRGGRRVVRIVLPALLAARQSRDPRRALSALLHEWGHPSRDLTRFFQRDASAPPGLWRSTHRFLLLPLCVLHLSALTVAGLVEASLVAPALASVCRARRYRADAAAVELAGNPIQLARALRNIASSLGDPDWTPVRLRTVVACDAIDPWRTPGRLAHTHPAAEKRIRRLVAKGAVLPWTPRPVTGSTKGPILERLWSATAFPFNALLAYVSAVVLALIAALTIGAMAVALGAIRSVFQLLQ